MSKIFLTNPFLNKDWDIFIQNHPEGTIFHTSNWARVIQRTYAYQPYYLVIEDSRREISAGIPFFLIKSWIAGNRIVSLPFTDECPPLITSTHDFYSIISSIEEMIKRENIKYCEIRGGNINFSNTPQIVKHSYYKNFKLNLTPGLDLLWRSFKQKSIRYPIKKAQNYDLKIVKTTDAPGMETFYKLNLMTRKKHGVIPQPYKFFENILREIFSAGFGFLLIANFKKKPIGASIFFTYKDKIYHKFNASDINYLKYQPNHLILWEAIKWAVKNGYKVLDLGRTAPDNAGLMAFKRHWGAEEIDLPYYYFPAIKGPGATKESSRKYKIASSIFKKMPIKILKIAGNLFYKYFG